MPVPRHPKEKVGGARLIALEDGGSQQIEVFVLLDLLAIQQHRGLFLGLRPVTTSNRLSVPLASPARKGGLGQSGYEARAAFSGTPLGAIRINRIHKHSRWGEDRLRVAPGMWGRGLMTEAVREVVALNRMEAWTLPGNDASDRDLVKAGFNYEGTLKAKAWFKGAFRDFRVFGRVAAHTLDV
jgi:ribosomal-protein-alanine N-acetyltransferase